MNNGTILSATWGYDQTNVSFYKVISSTAKTCTIVKVGSTATYNEDGTYSDKNVPDVSKTFGEPMRRKIYNYGDEQGVAVNSVIYASVWDGKPCFSSY